MNPLDSVVSRRLDAADKRLRREKEWLGLIIHHTGMQGWLGTDEPSRLKRAFENVAAWLTAKDDAFVSAHFQVSRTGEVWELCDPEKYEAFHAGISSALHPLQRKLVPDWNRWAIGIELLGDGNAVPYSEEQYSALIALVRELKTRFPSLHARAIYGHEEVSVGRKQDPGHLFDWPRFLRGIFVNSGFGITDTTATVKKTDN